jgi:hypothetical protein
MPVSNWASNCFGRFSSEAATNSRQCGAWASDLGLQSFFFQRKKTSLSYNKSDNSLIVVREAGNTAKVISAKVQPGQSVSQLP